MDFLDYVMGFVSKCTNNVVPKATAYIYPNKKPWVSLKLHTACNSGDPEACKAARYELIPGDRQFIGDAWGNYRARVESDLNFDPRPPMWSRLRCIDDYTKNKRNIDQPSGLLLD